MCLSGKTFGLDMIRLSIAQILWGMYYNKNVDFVELLWEDFVFQIDNKDTKKQEKMYCIHKGWVTNQTMKDSIAYKTYLAFSTRAATSKKARKFKKRVSPSKKRTSVLVEDPVRESAKKLEPAKKVVASKKPSRKQPPGVVIRDTHDVYVPKKKTPARVEKNKCIV
nr:hypothetical protein [Tanacetum cinerariifolium]